MGEGNRDLMFLLELSIDKVKFACESQDEEEGQICLAYTFLENGPYVIYEEDDLQPKQPKTCLFTISESQIFKFINMIAINIDIYKSLCCCGTPNNITFGYSLIKVGDLFKQLNRMMEEEDGPTYCKAQKDWFSMYSSKTDHEIGVFRAFIRLTCFGSMIINRSELDPDKILQDDRIQSCPVLYKKPKRRTVNYLQSDNQFDSYVTQNASKPCCIKCGSKLEVPSYTAPPLSQSNSSCGPPYPPPCPPPPCCQPCPPPPCCCQPCPPPPCYCQPCPPPPCCQPCPPPPCCQPCPLPPCSQPCPPPCQQLPPCCQPCPPPLCCQPCLPPPCCQPCSPPPCPPPQPCSCQCCQPPPQLPPCPPAPPPCLPPPEPCCPSRRECQPMRPICPRFSNCPKKSSERPDPDPIKSDIGLPPCARPPTPCNPPFCCHPPCNMPMPVCTPPPENMPPCGSPLLPCTQRIGQCCALPCDFGPKTCPCQQKTRETQTAKKGKGKGKGRKGRKGRKGKKKKK